MTDAVALLDRIGWSSRELARRLDCSETLVRRWLTHRAPMPPDVLRWLQAHAAWLERHPPPGWRVRDAA